MAESSASLPEPSAGRAPWWRTEDGWRVMLGAVPLLPWALFHLAEQWTAFGGRVSWLGRMRVTSAGPLMGALELIVVAACALWLVLLVRGRLRKRPFPGHEVAAESALGRALGTLEEPAAFLTAALVSVHALTLWLPRFLGQASLAQGYELLRTASGLPAGLLLAAFGISAFVVHVACVVPSAVLLVGGGTSRDTRQAARLVGVGFAVCLLILFTQLAGWHATGTGTVWPIQVVEVPDDAVPFD